MSKNEWNAFQWFQHKAIRWLYDLLVFLHDALIEWACERDLWRMPEEREEEEPEDPH